jgi:hypothetical protein
MYKHNSRESQRRSKLKISLPNPTPDWTFMTISLAGFHLGTMADAAIYFIRHDEAQLHSTWGAWPNKAKKLQLQPLSTRLSTIETVSYLLLISVSLYRNP